MSIPVSVELADENFLRIHFDHLRRLSKTTHFTNDEIDALAIIYFKFLDDFGVKRDRMDRSQLRAFFHSTFQICDDYIIDRVFLYLDRGTKRSPFVTLETWITILSLFLRGTLDEKMRYCFYIYDLGGVGRIKRNDMIKLLRKCFIYEKDEDIELMVKDLADLLMRKLDIDGDGEISYEDYSDSVRQQREILEIFGRCMPDFLSTVDFLLTFTNDIPI